MIVSKGDHLLRESSIMGLYPCYCIHYCLLHLMWFQHYRYWSCSNLCLGALFGGVFHEVFVDDICILDISSCVPFLLHQLIFGTSSSLLRALCATFPRLVSILHC